jgi:pre-rRNA-processing protein TSR3
LWLVALPLHHALPDVLILRDPREARRKCSLTPLRGVPGIRFVAYRRDRRVDAAGRVLLHPDGEVLSERDRGKAVLLVDCTWRHLPQLLGTLEGAPVRRRLPGLATAYPRSSKLGVDPAGGLASIEALYAALVYMGGEAFDLRSTYRWADEFLARNPSLAGSLARGT